MKFAVNAGEFDSALKSVQGRTRVSTTIPILKHILVSASEAKVSVLGNDLDSSSFASLDAEVALPGSWAIPAEPLIRVVSGLPKSAHIVVEFDGKPRQQVTVKSGRSRYLIPVMPESDFPKALSAIGGFTFDVTADELEQLFSRPSDVIAGKTRLELSGTFLHDEGGRIVSVGTDGHSLLRFGTQISSDGLDRACSPGHHGVIVPQSSLTEILKIGAGTVAITERTIEITSGSRSYCSKLVDATFPEQYRRVIPTADGAFVEIDREALVECLSRLASIGGFSDCKLIDVSVNDGEITVTLTGLAEGSETIECESETAVGKFFCLRTDQMLGACKAFRGDRVKIFVRGENEAIRLVDPSEPDAINVQVLCISKNRKAAVAA